MGADVAVFLFDVRRYERELLPAYRSFVERSDVKPLVSLLHQALPTAATGRRQRSFVRPREVYQEYIDILVGRVYYNSQGEPPGEPPHGTSAEDLRLFVDRSVAPALLKLICVPSTADFDTEQDMSKRGLTKFLYEHSRWIEDYFTFAKEPSGPRPEITLGEWNRLFSKEEVHAFNREVARMATPSDPETIEDFANLRALLRAVSEMEHMGLLMCVL